jgi:serine protease
MALPDNNFGAAGTAGPVGEPLMILTTYDPVLSTSAILEAKSRGAKIINMSFQTQVPGVVGWTLLPYERVTEDVRNSGVLIFASAGNDGANMDREDCWWVFCWKATVYAPCENDGVICVAGIQANDYAGTENDSVGKHPGSNYGSKVDMYAPFSVYSGPDPDTGGNQAIGVSGTSFSSPYAAGVAALIWAANPALSAGDVWQVLYSTSHERYGMHWPNAYFAVLGQIPQSLFAEIRSPHSGSEVEVNQPIDFVGELTYISLPGDPATVDLTWKDNGNVFYQQEVTMPRASNDGINTMQVYATSNGLAAGDHTIRLEVEGNVRMVYTSLHTSANHEISLAVGNSPPTVTIHSPAEGATFCSGQHITFRGSAIDLGDIRIGIPDHNFRWYSSLWGGPFGEGPTYTSQLLPVGRQTITLRVTDSGGATGEDSTTMTVLDAGSAQCADFPPEAKILSPADGSKYTPTGTDEKGKYITVTLVGQATDREDAESELTVEWYSDVEGFLGSGRSLTVRLHAGTGPTTHTITLRVKDTAGHVTEDPIRIRIEVFV